ncbi:MAG: hypothetical protein ABI689_07915 [Thermoanaerobaculia bacterium]
MIRWGLGIAGTLLAGSLLAQASETPLAELEAGAGKAGWDGLALGMSSVQVERRTGITLAMQPGSSSGGGCRTYMVTVERNTLSLSLGFPSSKPGAKLLSIYVRFEGYQITAKQEALVRELKERIPGASYRPPKLAPPPSEAADPAPVYLIPDSDYAARLVPGDGLWITLRSCLD